MEARTVGGVDKAGVGRLRRWARPTVGGLRAVLGTRGSADALAEARRELARLAATAAAAVAAAERNQAGRHGDVMARLAEVEALLVRPASVQPEGRVVRFTLPDGRPYLLSIDDPAGDPHRIALAQHGGQSADWRFCMAWLRPGDVLLDLGANIGAFSVPAAVAGAEVHAFELLAGNAASLVFSAELNGLSNLRVTLGAVWHEAGVVGYSGHSAWGRVEAAPALIAAVRMDDYVAQRRVGRVDTVKMDVEGAERSALLGAEWLLARDRPDILFESNTLTCGGFGYSYRDLLRHLAERGYRLFRVGAGVLHPWRVEMVQEVVQTDYFATARGDDEVEGRCGWPIRALAEEEVIETVLGEDRFSDYHRMHLLCVRERLPAGVRGDRRVAALLERWAPLASSAEFGRLVVGTA